MVDLSDYQFELGGIVFGKDQAIEVDDEGFDPGTDDVETQDVFSALTQAFGFGEDSTQPAIWTWSLHTDDARTAEEALAADRELALAWLLSVDRRDPGSVAALRYAIGGRTRVVYGRPRRYATDKNNGMTYGLLRITADFQRVDNLFYGEDEFTIYVGAQPTTTPGLISPITSPITTIENVPTNGTTPPIGGDVPAPFLATINGPDSGSLINPRLSTPSWEIQLNTEIAAGSSVVVNTYPWGLRAIRDDGANLSGFLSARSRLSKARLAVEGETLQFDGLDSSGTATCSVTWRSAYATI